MAFFTSGADLDIGIVNQFLLNSNGITQGWGQAIIDQWDPTGGLPPNPNPGDKYISLATSNGWILNNIMYFSNGFWQPQEPVNGALVWSNVAGEYLGFNPGTNTWSPLLDLIGFTPNVVFTGNSTWVVPANVNMVRAVLVGGGGGGAVLATGSGGGAGSALIGYPISPAPGTSVNIIIGSGGTAGNPGTNTSISYPGTTITAYAGGAGDNTNGGGGGGAGGSATGTTGGAYSGQYPVQGPPGASGNATSSEGSVQGFVVSGGSGGAPGATGSNNLTHTGGAAGPGGGGAAGAMGPGGNSGSAASANTGAGGGSGAAGGSGFVLLQTL